MWTGETDPHTPHYPRPSAPPHLPPFAPPPSLAHTPLLDVDIAWPLSASCIVGDLGFYTRLIVSTLGPLTVLVALAFLFSIALYRHSANSPEAAVARQHAIVRHASAALLVCFLVSVFTCCPRYNRRQAKQTVERNANGRGS